MNRKVLLTLYLVGCAADQVTQPATTRHAPSFSTDSIPDSLPSVVKLIGAGDIAGCGKGYKDELTVPLILAEPDARVFAAGDLAYTYGSLADWVCYNASWGQFKDRTWPAIGNHELHASQTPPGKNYWDYWNGVGIDSGVAGVRGKGYYALWHGDWRLLVLNSDYAPYTGTDTSIGARRKVGMQEQATFIRADLTANPVKCQLAIFHRPRFTSVATMAPTGWVPPLYRALWDKRADVVIGGHHHQYERTERINYNGVIDTVRGFVQFVAGAGGANSLNYFLATPKPYSRARVRAYGVLFLELGAEGYRFEYRTIAGTVADSGSGVCR